ncbi:MAG: four helix bundle protein [Candidatus Kuenenia sp.]|nr:four helix bundle protein [Candidatus Kuenenia sp.]
MDKVQLQSRTKNFALRVFNMVEKLPKSKGTEVIIYQLIKASTSVAANYRAACRAKSRADFINKLKIVEEESDESLFWLEFIADLNLIDFKLLENLLKEADELVAIFTAAIKTTKNNS